SIAVDRTTGPNRGRVYVAWNESLDWFQFASSLGSAISEPVETGLNNVAANAKSFSVGNVLRGSLASQNDLDWFKFSLTAGPGVTVSGAVYGGYRVKTNFASNTGERGRDQRDAFITSSDNGTTWTIPVRVNDDAVGFDEYLSEVAVGADGCPYVSWFDFRDD